MNNYQRSWPYKSKNVNNVPLKINPSMRYCSIYRNNINSHANKSYN